MIKPSNNWTLSVNLLLENWWKSPNHKFDTNYLSTIGGKLNLSEHLRTRSFLYTIYWQIDSIKVDTFLFFFQRTILCLWIGKLEHKVLFWNRNNEKKVISFWKSFSHLLKLVSDEINIFLAKLNLKDNLPFYKIHLLPLNFALKCMYVLNVNLPSSKVICYF